MLLVLTLRKRSCREEWIEACIEVEMELGDTFADTGTLLIEHCERVLIFFRPPFARLLES
jgi:hypothetical protein